MKLDDIETEWARDSALNADDLQAEITRTAKLHSKWYTTLNSLRRDLLSLDVDIQKWTNALEGYYSRTLTVEEMTKFGFKELPEKRLLKGDLDKAIANHQKMIELKIRRGLAVDKLKFVEDIIKNIHGRGFLIRDLIEWKKFVAGN